MSFSGSLSEFDISNIFLLIEQDVSTGELIIVTTDNRYSIFFKNGQLVNAHSEEESIKKFLIVYLRDVKKYSTMELKELDAAFQGNIHLLSEELLKKGYLTQQEFSIIVQSGIIDITSAIFSIKKGNYIFETKPNVDAYQFLSLAIPANFVMLDSARIKDESTEVASIITEESIFESSIHLTPSQVNEPISNFDLYALSYVNGSRTVKEICQKMFFSSRHVYIALNKALQKKQIRLLNSPDAALDPIRKKSEKDSTDNRDIIISSTITALLSLTMLLGGVFIYHGKVVKDLANKSWKIKKSYEINRAVHNLTNAQQIYQVIYHKEPSGYEALRKEHLLTDKEIGIIIRSDK